MYCAAEKMDIWAIFFVVSYEIVCESGIVKGRRQEEVDFARRIDKEGSRHAIELLEKFTTTSDSAVYRMLSIKPCMAFYFN